MNYEVLLDTSFFIRLLNENDPLNLNVKSYFYFFVENNIRLHISTISVAEFCVFSKFENLPLKYLNILDFQLNHSKRAAEFAKIIFEIKKSENLKIEPRVLIPNDTKLFAQTDIENQINYFATSDKRSKKIYNLLDNQKQITTPNFTILDITLNLNENLNLLNK